MRRIVILVTFGAALAALGAMACGGNDKPPLTPDPEHTTAEPSSDASAPPSTPPAK